MKNKTVYFEDVGVPNRIVRKRPHLFELEYITKEQCVWTKTLANSLYEREYYLGEGDNCLFEISYEEARKRLAEWDVLI